MWVKSSINGVDHLTAIKIDPVPKDVYDLKKAVLAEVPSTFQGFHLHVYRNLEDSISLPEDFLLTNVQTSFAKPIIVKAKSSQAPSAGLESEHKKRKMIESARTYAKETWPDRQENEDTRIMPRMRTLADFHHARGV